jgi:hypothetical protein
MKANNFNVMRAWWSVDGKHGKWQKYTLLVFGSLLDKFSGPVSATGVPVPVTER